MRKGLLFLIPFVVLSVPAWANGLGGGLWAAGVAMGQVNESIAAYNQANETALGALNLGFGGEVALSLPDLWRIAPVIGLRGLAASSSSDRIQTDVSILGGFLGGAVTLAGWTAGLDVGAYRSVFSFPAGQYEGLVGWSVGLVGSVGYAVTVGSLRLFLKLTLDWLPANELYDSTGGLYASREGAFLDFSGLGAMIGASWSF